MKGGWARWCVGALLLAAWMARGAGAPQAGPNANQRVLGPPWLQECLVYYSAFEGAPGKPDVARSGIETIPRSGRVEAGAGLVGKGLHVRDGAQPFTLRGAALSPHRPLTLSFWWALPYDLTIDGGYTLFYLRGKGFVAAFCRGKGEWCALQRPAGVFQIYYLPGIQNVNGIYETDLMSRLDLRRGVWHHTAVVFRRGTTAQMYTDGQPVFEVTTAGRPFGEQDDLRTLDLGGPLLLDELAVLDRAVESDMILDYFRGIAQIRRYLSRE